MAVVARGRTVEGDAWELDVSFGRERDELRTMVDLELAGGDKVWGGGCGGPAVAPGKRVNSYVGAGDRGPRIFIARVTSEVRAVVVTLSDGTREDLVVHQDLGVRGIGVAVLVYARDLDIHRLDLFGVDGEPLPLD